MKEFEKQVVLFGNFEYIDFQNIIELSSFFSKYEMSLDGVPDYPKETRIPITMDAPKIRPMFGNKNKSKRVIFGSFRISIEEYDNSIYKYDDFSTFAESLIEILFEKFGLKVYRLAVNGRIILDTDLIPKYYNKYVSNVDFEGNINNFGINVEKREYSDDINIEINKIFNVNRANISIMNKTTSDYLMFSYDYNTMIQETRFFEYKDYLVFKERASSFRSQIISDVMKL